MGRRDPPSPAARTACQRPSHAFPRCYRVSGWRPPLPPSSGRGAGRGHRRRSCPIQPGNRRRTPLSGRARARRPLKLENPETPALLELAPGRDAGGAGVRGPEPQGGASRNGEAVSRSGALWPRSDASARLRALQRSQKALPRAAREKRELIALGFGRADCRPRRPADAGRYDLAVLRTVRLAVLERYRIAMHRGRRKMLEPPVPLGGATAIRVTCGYDNPRETRGSFLALLVVEPVEIRGLLAWRAVAVALHHEVNAV
jgi:hypothetical protein